MGSADMTETKALSTLAVATLTTGIAMVEGFAGVSEAAEWIVGHPVWTHELGKAADRAIELIPQQYPEFPTEIAGTWQETREAVLARYGETIEVQRGTDRREAHPMDTLQEAVAKAKGR